MIKGFCKPCSEKLEREGKRVTRQDLPIMDCWKWGETNSEDRKETHQALLINIEPIEKPKPTYEELEKELFVLKTQLEMEKSFNTMVKQISCEHPKEKVSRVMLDENKEGEIVQHPTGFICSCGARVQPSSFVEEK